MKQLYQNDEYWFNVVQDEASGKLFLEVSCGGVAVYTARLEMNNDEIAMFRENPLNLRDIAWAVSHTPDKFKERVSYL